MSDYKAPLRDIRFIQNELLNYPEHYTKLPDAQDATPDMVDTILDEAAKFCEQVLAPLNAVGDEQGCVFNNGEVTTPAGFKEAYQQFVAGGWPSLSGEKKYGGQGLPHSLGITLNELMGEANWAWSMYPGLSHGAMNTLAAHGTEDQKQSYLTQLISGQWTGTMCLTEPQCGTDLGMLTTKAEPQENGTYKISGSKIYISSGEHDMSENIVHIVLARLPGAPEGTRGISLFIVPKFLPNDDNSIGQRNSLQCGSIEKKMGIHGNATCVMNFDSATGFLIGEPNKGLSCMFTFMNVARIGTGLQGLSHTEIAFQNAIAYSKDRLQGRSLSGSKTAKSAADPIIVHPDVRRMLLTTKAFAEGNRALIYYTAKLVDQVERPLDKDTQEEAHLLLGLLTPIVKAFITETGFESANLGLQCFGGHGYIKEWGMEQNVRDSRISTLYEGTTGIQALDLLGRKILMTQGKSLKCFTKIIHKFCKAHENTPHLKDFLQPLEKINKEWGDLTMAIGMKALKDKAEVGAAAFDYLMYSGYICLAYFWADMARIAHEALKKEGSDKGFYLAKIQTAQFYYSRILPRTSMHKHCIESGADNLLAMDTEHFLMVA